MPISRDPRKAARQKAQLQPVPVGPGNQLARTHGGYARIAHEELSAERLRIFNAIGEDVPVQDGRDGSAITALARAEIRLRRVEAWIDEHGEFDDEGNIHPAVDLERRLRLELSEHHDALGLNPRSRSRIGLDVAKSFDLAKTRPMPRLDYDAVGRSLAAFADAIGCPLAPFQVRALEPLRARTTVPGGAEAVGQEPQPGRARAPLRDHAPELPGLGRIRRRGSRSTPAR